MTVAEVETRANRPSADVIPCVAPATGESLGEVPVMGPSEVRLAVDRARSAQRSWAVLSVEERAERLLRFRDRVVERADALVELLSRETGKPRQEALSHEVIVLADAIGWVCKTAPRALAPREIELHLMKHRRSVIEHVPRGVVAILSPWNFPLSIPFGDAVVAWVTGSAVVIKPSELASLIALEVKKLWDESGLPEDLLQIVTGYGETGAALIDAGVNKVVFTGSVATGRRVAAACGERLIPCVMELGGKAPLIACADCDLERTARAIVAGGFANSGQACISVERVYAHKDVHDRLLERVVALTKELRQGNPDGAVVDVGAITLPRQAEIVAAHVEDALAKGAKLQVGGKRKGGKGTFFEPTVLSECTHEMSVMTQEIFGPIVPFMRVESEEQAVAMANDSHLGLNAYVFTSDRERGRRLAGQVSAGSVVVNDVLTNFACPEAPFGGVRQSGFGRVHGEDALRDMAEVRHLSFDRIRPPSRDPLWYPYSDKAYDLVHKGMRVLFSRRGVLGKLKEIF